MSTGVIIEVAFWIPSLCLNIIIVVAVCLVKRLHTTPNVFIASLAGSEVLFGLLICACLLLSISDRQNKMTEVAICTNIFLTMLSVFSSHFNHIIISVERWLYIARPFLHQRLVTSQTTACGVVLVWILAGASSLNLLIDCGNSDKVIVIGIVDPCVHFLLFIVMFSLYVHISVIARKQMLAIEGIKFATDPRSRSEAQNIVISLKRRWSTVRLLVTVIGTYFILLTPQVCANIYAFATGNFKEQSESLFDLSRILTLLHNYCTFFVYAKQDKDFKRAVKHYLSKIWCKICVKKISPLNSEKMPEVIVVKEEQKIPI